VAEQAAPTSSLTGRIQAARKAKKDYRDVDVVLDQEIREQVEQLDEQIEELEGRIAGLDDEKTALGPELRFSDPRPAKIDQQIEEIREQIIPFEDKRDGLQQGALVTLRFDKMDGEQWAALAARHPARIDVTIDRLSGYDYHATARDAAPLCGYALGDDESREDLSKEDWDGLWPIISGREAENIATSLWELNDWSPAAEDRGREKRLSGRFRQQVELALSTSGSHPGVSPGGNPPDRPHPP
jgi:hypothetical protein